MQQTRAGPDYELEALLSLDGQEFNFARGYVVKLEPAGRMASNPALPSVSLRGGGSTASTMVEFPPSSGPVGNLLT
jgi:hypothetical protein